MKTVDSKQAALSKHEQELQQAFRAMDDESRAHIVRLANRYAARWPRVQSPRLFLVKGGES